MTMEFSVVGGSPPTGGLGVYGQEMAIYPSFGAGAVSLKPDEFSGAINGGHYSVAAFTSAAAFAGGVVVASFRWADSARICAIKRVRVAMNVVTAVTAQAGPDCDMIVSRAYSASETTNATAVTLPNSTGKMRGSKMASSAVTQIAVASAAAGISGGTRSQDTSTVGNSPVPLTGFTIGGASPFIPLFDCAQNGQHPLVLEANEGFLIRNTTAIASGTVRYYVAIDWMEAAGF